jgi:hypothetical protein
VPANAKTKLGENRTNHIDIATGILTASLNLTRIDNIEKKELSLLRDSFTSVRQALLFKENTSSNNTNNQESLDKEGELSTKLGENRTK